MISARYDELNEQIKEIEIQIDHLKGKWSKENKVKRTTLYMQHGKLCDQLSIEFGKWHKERKKIARFASLT